jgi:hypothetical protein
LKHGANVPREEGTTSDQRGASQPELPLWGEPRDATGPKPVNEQDGKGEHGLEALVRIDWSFAGSAGRGLTHNLHPWPAKFIPEIPATAIRLLTEPGDVVLDPFCGCGTTAVEALYAGRGSISTDVNPLAALVTQGKCSVPDQRARRDILLWSQDLKVQEPASELLSMAPPIPNLEYWFDPPVVAQLAYLRREIAALGIAAAFMQTVFSSIIVGVSHQESETRYRRVERETSAELTLARFRKRLGDALRMAVTLDRVRDSPHPRQVQRLDARAITAALPASSCHLAVFSPPYPNAFDYHLYHRFRMFWLGMDPRPIKHEEIGAHLRYQPDQAEWLHDMSQAFMGLVHCLVPGGYAVCVVGDGVIAGQVVPSGDLLWEVGPVCGLTRVWRTTRDVARHRRAFNLADARLAQEQVLVFRR